MYKNSQVSTFSRRLAELPNLSLFAKIYHAYPFVTFIILFQLLHN